MANFIIDVAATFQTLLGFTPVALPTLGSELEQVYPGNKSQYNIPGQPQQGAAANPYNLSVTKAQRTRPYNSGIAAVQDDQITDMIGRPVWLPVTLIVGQDEYVLPYCVMSLRNKKIIKETPMVERGGSVIEEIGLGPWELEIKGFLIDQYDQFPDDQLGDLNALYIANQTGTTQSVQPVELKCALSDIFLGPTANVVITELEIPAKAKVIGVRDFTMHLIQDSILSLYPVQQTNVSVDPAIDAALQVYG